MNSNNRVKPNQVEVRMSCVLTISRKKSSLTPKHNTMGCDLIYLSIYIIQYTEYENSMLQHKICTYKKWCNGPIAGSTITQEQTIPETPDEEHFQL